MNYRPGEGAVKFTAPGYMGERYQSIGYSCADISPHYDRNRPFN